MLNPLDGVVVRRGKDSDAGRRPCVAGGRGWSHLTISQGMPRLPGAMGSYAEASKDSPLEPTEEAKLC